MKYTNWNILLPKQSCWISIIILYFILPSSTLQTSLRDGFFKSTLHTDTYFFVISSPSFRYFIFSGQLELNGRYLYSLKRRKVQDVNTPVSRTLKHIYKLHIRTSFSQATTMSWWTTNNDQQHAGFVRFLICEWVHVVVDYTKLRIIKNEYTHVSISTRWHCEIIQFQYR